jgi:hypothetical protein
MARALFVHVLLCGLLFGIDAAAQAQSGMTGTWITTDFDGNQPNLIDLQANAATVTGTISRGHEALTIYDGRIDGDTVTFKVIFAAGDRTNTYTGTLNGNEMSFTRSVRVRPGGNATGAGIFGGGGPMQFVAKRDNAGGLTVPRALFGDWKLNLQRSKYSPGPVPRPTVADVRNYVSRPGGGVGMGLIAVSAEGTPTWTLATFKADGKDYPVYNGATLAAFLGSATPTTLTTSFRALDDRTYEITSKNRGTITATRRLTVSPDGNTLTDIVKNVDAKGQTTATNTMVFDRIAPAVPQSAN